MSKLKNKQLWLPFTLAFLLFIVIVTSHPMGKIDRVWSDILLTSQQKTAKQEYLIVDITAQNIGSPNKKYIPRDTLAKTLNRLREAGAKRILLDMTLSEKLASHKDLSLTLAMAHLGPDRLALSEGSDPKFSAHATELDLRLVPGQDGWTRDVQTAVTNKGHNPSTWLATGQLSVDTIKVDLRYDPKTIEHVDIDYILNHSNLNLANRHVLIGTSPFDIRSRVQLPMTDIADRSSLLILGSQSISSGHPEIAKKSWRVNLAIAFIFLVIGALSAAKIKNTRLLFIAGLIMSIAVVSLNMQMMKMWGGQGYPVMQFLCFIIGLALTIAHRFHIIQMISGFLKGDLSPEEAWTWRAHEDSQFPVILLNGLGQVRRMNATALDMQSSLGDDFGERCLGEFNQGSAEISLLAKDGSVRKFALERPNASVSIIALKDVTETSLKFDALEANRLSLQKKVDGLRKLQSRTVEQAETSELKKIRAEKSSQSKSDFLANMSHELRTPLNAINGFSDIMHRELFGPLGDPRYKKFASDILFSGQHLLSLINDILDLSKIEAGKMTLKSEQVQVNELIGQVTRMLKMRADGGGLTLIYSDNPLPKIEADPRAVKQILLNLLTNAIKFTPQGGQIKVLAETVPEGLIIHVSDSGIGISEEDIKRLAQPFEQVDTEHGKNMEGTGLGLSLSKSLVELHGGTFSIASKVGAGTTMSFTLPMVAHAVKTEDIVIAPQTKQVLTNIIQSPPDQLEFIKSVDLVKV
ncbi:MAG: ATP-binding protein [Litorimonas sp.]